MKKHLFFIVLFFAAINFVSAQVIADFEDGTTGPLTLHVMGCGDWDNVDIHPVDETFTVIDNPDASGINTSSKVMKFVRRGTDNGGMPWGGFWANVDPNIDVTTNKYIHYMVWKPAISPCKFKLEGGPSGTLETASINTQSASGKWVDMVFDFTTFDGAYPTCALMPDFADPLTTTGDVDIYIDNIQITNSPNPIGEPITGMVADFENGTTGPLTLHVMGNGDWDNPDIHPVNETFNVIDNPDASGINTSSKVLQFVRRGTDNGGMPWGGFWANLDPNVDLTVNKYAHVMVWKPAISPVKFKMEGGPSGTLETPSINSQAAASEWVDMVFDFTTLNGAYPICALMPDFADPFTTTGDVTIYIDNIQFTDDPTPIGGGTGLLPVTFSVNMSYQISLGNFNASTDYVDIAGNFNGWDGANSHLSPSLDAGIYTITIDGFTVDQALEFKFRINGDWNTSEFPNGGPNRTYTVVEGTNAILVWYNDEEFPAFDGTMANFEDDTWGILTPHAMGMGDFDNPDIHPFNETFNIINNPDKSGPNKSEKVVEFIRRGTDNGGMAWGGFFAQCNPKPDFTTNKYVHVMVWKPMESPVYFKIEGGSGTPGFLEIPSTNPQNVTDGWIDCVFDFSSMPGGEYPTVVLMPDFVHPVEDFVTAEDVIIYFDNIVLNSDPNPNTGIKDNKADFEVSVYPNPCNNSFKLDLANDMSKVEITNIVGQVVVSMQNVDRGTVTVDVTDLQSGIYFISLTDKDNKVATAKLMKN